MNEKNNGLARQEIESIIHFYYCLLIALKSEVKNGGLKHSVQKSIFILRWLKSARKKRLFCRQVSKEIDWLAGYLKNQGNSFGYAEKLIETIHEQSSKILRDGVGQYVDK